MTAAPTPGLSLPERARLFHALSDETRLAILDLLRAGERCVCELQQDLDAAQSRLSFHLGVLRDAGLVTDRKAGRWSYYAVVPEKLASVAGAISESPGQSRPAVPQVHRLTRMPAGSAGVLTASRVGGECCR